MNLKKMVKMPKKYNPEMIKYIFILIVGIAIGVWMKQTNFFPIIGDILSFVTG
jgi:hypothetical protein